MSFTQGVHGFHFLGSPGANPVTISVPSNAFVSILTCGFGAVADGTVSDGTNTYTHRFGASNANFGGWCEVFDCANTTGTSSTVTYTPGTSNTGSFFVVQIFTATASPSFGSASNVSTTSSLTANSLTSASLTCSSADGIGIAMSWDGNGPATDMTVGTSPTVMTLGDNLVVAGGHFGISEFGALTGPAAVTCTPAEAAVPVAFLAASYFISGAPSNTASIAWVV